MRTEDTSSDEEEENKEKEALNLRSYQKELAAPGLQGKNCIIVAPTGSGKTHVALKIMQVSLIKEKLYFALYVYLITLGL
jgi:superfamily II DNA or RNA helicase